MAHGNPVYKRILLKISGEMLQGTQPFGIDLEALSLLAADLVAVRALGVEVGLVVGAGNYCRGAALSQVGVNRVTADHMGMLATMMNSLAIQDALIQQGQSVCVLSSLEVAGVLARFTPQAAKAALSAGQIVIFAGGTGNPLFTTDTAASLRAIEIDAQLLLKATKVDGIYSEDPIKNPQATFFKQLTFEQVLSDQLAVMDLSAICLCRDHGLPIRVFNFHGKNNLLRIVSGESVGTLVGEKK
jgi:uridylate kinase